MNLDDSEPSLAVPAGLSAFASQIFDQLLEAVAYCRLVYQDGRPCDFVYVYTNRAFHRQTGLGPVIGMRASEVLPGFLETDKALFDLCSGVARNGGEASIEYFVRTLRLRVEIRVCCPQTDHFIALFRKLARRDGSEETAGFRSIVADRLMEGICVVGADGLLLYTNRRYDEMLGYAPGELLGQNFSGIAANEERPASSVWRDKVDVSGSGGAWHGEIKSRCKNGRELILRARVTGYEDDSAGPVWLVHQWDVTDLCLRCEQSMVLQATYQAVFETSNLAIGISRLSDGRFVDVNDRFLSLFGFPRFEVIGHTSAELKLWPYPEERARMLEALRSGRSVQNFSAHFQTKAGALGELRVATAIACIRGEDYLIGMLADVTQYARQERLLEEQQAELSLLMDTVPAYIWMTRDPACSEIVGNAPANALELAKGKKGGMAGPPGETTDRASVVRKVSDGEAFPLRVAVTADRPVLGRELLLRHPSSEDAVLLGNSIPLHDSTGRVRGGIAAFIDITELRTAERTLAVHADILRRIEEGINVVAASSETIVYVNASFESMFGYAKDELIGSSPAVLNAPGELTAQQQAQAIVETLERTGSWCGEVRNVRKDGSTFWTYAAITQQLLSPWGRVWISVQRDISERKKADEQRDNYLAQLEVLVEERTAALRSEKERLSLALLCSNQGAWDSDRSSGKVTFDERLCAIIGYAPDEVFTDTASWIDHIHPDDRERTLESMRAHERGESPSFQQEYRIRHKDGHWVWVRSIGKIIARDAAGTALRLAGTMQDISAQKRMGEEGVALLKRIEDMIRAVADGRAQLPVSGKANGAALDQLTRRQRQILTMVAKGMTSTAIAAELKIAKDTVITHRRGLMQKLMLHSTAEVTRFAIQHGLLGT